jgi:hypothetical protein
MQNTLSNPLGSYDHEQTQNKIIKISKMQYSYRSSEETEIYIKFLSNFDIFQKKVPKNQLNSVLKAATQNLKYIKVSAGQFLYHIGKTCSLFFTSVSFILFTRPANRFFDLYYERRSLEI